MKAEIVGVSFGLERGVAAYVPLRHDYAGAPEQLDRDEERRKLGLGELGEPRACLAS